MRSLICSERLLWLIPTACFFGSDWGGFVCSTSKCSQSDDVYISCLVSVLIASFCEDSTEGGTPEY